MPLGRSEQIEFRQACPGVCHRLSQESLELVCQAARGRRLETVAVGEQKPGDAAVLLFPIAEAEVHPVGPAWVATRHEVLAQRLGGWAQLEPGEARAAGSGLGAEEDLKERGRGESPHRVQAFYQPIERDLL